MVFPPENRIVDVDNPVGLFDRRGSGDFRACCLEVLIISNPRGVADFGWASTETNSRR